MELKEFIENFADQFEDTDISELKPETEYRKLDEWSSLVGLCVIAMVSDEYHVTIGGQELRSCDTIEELFRLVRTKKGE